ncbi:hypothetical protein D9611_013526 [Ephemerocybe angulata]|uniref:Ras-GAP domain-containing protein n=1 Tax=Ephemerocybe angulata TaxID=980116 RepID=A0A8H5C362_9AGAR|nr:hypothetical protein D9611_013526 [Tulosesus angulatus]
MPRRASASAGQPNNFFATTSARVHKTTESHHVLPAPPSSSIGHGQPATVPPMGHAGSPQQKVVHVLVQRLKSKLPCNSGQSLDKLESDPLTQQAIETLVELSHDSLDIIAWALSELADRLAKQTDSASGYPTIETLQSQLFVLKVLSMTMASRWNANRRPASRATTASPDSPHTTAGSKRSRAGVASSFYTVWPEFDPLDESCAKYVLSVMVLFLRQTTNYEVPLLLATPSTDLSFRDFDLPQTTSFENDAGPPLRTQPSSASVRSAQGSVNSVIRLPPVSRTYEKTHLSLVRNSEALSNMIAKYTGRIIFHISATNWGVVHNRLKTKIRFLGAHSEENPDTVDLQLLAHSLLDRQRLVTLLGELASLLIHFSREAQLAIAISLRAAVWGWIDRFPQEFNEVIRSRGRTEAQPERVFDLLCAMANATPGHERILWPCLTILSCITYDRISIDSQQYNSGNLKRKEQRFGQELLKHIRSTSKLSEISMACAVDMCRVAANVTGTDDVPLVMVASDLAHEIKAALWTGAGRRPFWDTENEIDVALYADALCAIFQFLPEEDSLPLFAACIDPERSPAVKTCVVRAMLTLLSEVARFPGRKSLEKLQEVLGKRCRDVLKSAASKKAELDSYGTPKMPRQTPRGKRVTPDPLSDTDILVLAVLSLWRADPKFTMDGIKEEEVGAWVDMATGLWGSTLDIGCKISVSSNLATVAEMAVGANSGSEMGRLAVGCLKSALPQALSAVAIRLLYERNNVEEQHLWTAMGYHVLDLYCKKIDAEHIKRIQRDPARIPGVTLLEIALLATLPAANTEMSLLATKGLRLISLVDRQPDAPVSTLLGEEETSKRNFIYQQLGDPRVVTVGRVVHQKRVRRLIRLISYKSPVHPAVWAECYARWKAISQPVYEAMRGEGTDVLDSSPNQTEMSNQWQNLTLFLATLCGACAWDKQESLSLMKTVPLDVLPDRLRVPSNVPALAESFISDLLQLFLHHETMIRDTAREALGTELSPRFHAKLIRFIEGTMRTIEEGSEKHKLTPSDSLMFLDQTITTLRLLTEDKPTSAEDSMSIDISSLMLSLLSSISRTDDPGLNRIKIKFCGLCRTLCDRSDILTMRKDDTVRNAILDRVLSWLTPLTGSKGVNGGGGNGHADFSEPGTQELNMACLRTMVKLLERLKLRAPDVANVSGAGTEPTDGETALVMSGVFKRYSDRLLGCLDDCAGLLPSDSVSEFGSVNQKSKAAQSKEANREAELRELVITGLTHLVSANSESGFKQCLHLAYDQDSRKRTIFAHVFARVIGEGTTFDLPEKVPTVSKRARFADLLLGSDMVLAMTMCEICPPSEVEAIIPVLLSVFDTRESMLALLKLMIEREISQTAETETTLFRSNSTCTRLLSAFARINGYTFLRILVDSLIKSLQAGPEGTEFELDPYQTSRQEFEQNRNNVNFGVKSFTDILTKSGSSVPGLLREICVHIGQCVSEIWPGSQNTALGAFIFLRFISPAVVSPEIIDLQLPKEDETNLRRGLMNVGRTVQSLANHIFFGKELPPSADNEYLEHNATALINFLEMLQEPAATAEDWTGHGVPDDTDVIVLHRFFDKHADKIGKELLSLSKPSSEGDITAINGKRAWDGLCALLVDLGTPSEVPRPSALTSDKHDGYQYLMRECAGRDLRPVSDLFVEVDVPQNQPALFVLNFSKLDIEDLDIKTLIVHIFKILTKDIYAKRAFDVVVDCTGFSSKSELPFQWLKFCAEVVPSDIRSRFRTAHILNPNSLMHKYLRRLFNISAGTPYSNEVKGYVSVRDLLEHVPGNVVPHLEEPIQAERAPLETFSDVVYLRDGASIPVEIAISNTHIRVTTTKAFPISLTFPCRYVEIIPLSQVKDAYNTVTETQIAEFVIRRRHICMTFSSQNRDAIVKHVRSVKAKLKEVQAPLSERFSRFSNVPATLLHIGFLSVDPVDEELRSAAYDLLGAVCSYLKYDKTPIVARKAGFIPGDPFAFVTQLSEQLAEFAPQLTLDFIHEICAAMTGMPPEAVAQRISCLHYLNPWIRNLSIFASPTSVLFDKSGTRLRDCVRTLADLSLSFPEITGTLQKSVWNEMAKLDSFTVDVILDELVRAASDGGGVGTKRCEVIRQVIASLSSINVRSRMNAKLRKALSKNSQRPVVPEKGTRTLVNFSNWTEISTLIRLISALGSYTKQPGPTQMFVPETIYLVSLVVAEGHVLVRKSVYGIVMNLLQSLYISRTDDMVGSELLRIIDECSCPQTLKYFGLKRETPTSEYENYDAVTDKEHLEDLDGFMQLLVRIMDVSSGSRGLLNTWRARWMGLITSTAFQVSPVIQTRSFASLAALATSDVEEDFLYQILTALHKALDLFTDKSTLTVLSMLRCVSKMLPHLVEYKRYIPSLFWLGVALLQTGHMAFFEEASVLMRVTLEIMEKAGFFRHDDMSNVLLDARRELEEITLQLDDMLGISFATNFSLSLAHVIFKGVRTNILANSAEELLRTLLTVTVRSQHRGSPGQSNGLHTTLHPEALGYFLALVPRSFNADSYRRLLKESMIDEAWYSEAGLPNLDEDDASAPRLTPAFLGINDSRTALFVATFLGITLGGSQGDDAETEMMYGLLAELAIAFPDVISIVYESIRDRIKDTFAGASNPNIIRSASTILRVYVSLQQEQLRYDQPRGSSQSTLNERDEATTASLEHLAALDEYYMKGLSWRLTFVQLNREDDRRHIIAFIKDLITLLL